MRLSRLPDQSCSPGAGSGGLRIAGADLTGRGAFPQRPGRAGGVDRGGQPENRAPRSAPCGRLPPHAEKPDTGGRYAECLLRLLQRLSGIAGLLLEVGKGPGRRFGISAQTDGNAKFFRHGADGVLSFRYVGDP